MDGPAMGSDGRAIHGSSLYQSHEVTGQVASTGETLPSPSCLQGMIGRLFGPDHLNICCRLTWSARGELDHATVWWSVNG